ncbi:MAG: hypothetical protein AAB706_03800 [Patescibacteria group bacterium]
MNKHTLIKSFFIFVLFLTLSLASNAQLSEPDPIVIIPGFGSSLNTDVFTNKTLVQTPWGFSENAKNYNNLINALEISGFVEGQNLFIAHYDWRKNNTDSVSNYLIPVINQAKQYSQSGKVDIIAHSMGGLVARAYIQGSNYRNDVDQFFMLGTPNYGSSDAYGVWEGGRLPDHWSEGAKADINKYLWYLDFSHLSIRDNYDAIHTFFPSIKELLPVYDYVTDKDTQITKFTSNLNEQNPLLAWLNSETGLFDLQDRVREITMVAGTGSSTVNTIPVVDRGTEPKLWVDGKPDPLDPIPNDAIGDNTVLAFSAEIDFPYVPVLVKDDTSPFLKWFAQFFTPVHAQSAALINYYVVSSPHEELPTNAISHIFASLGLSAPSGVILPPYEPNAILSFWFASPVDVKVVAPDGTVITKDINEIPEAFYESTSDPLGPKFVTIPNPINGEYKIELTGIGNGEYHMGVSHIDDDSDIVNTVQGTVITGQEIGYTVNYDPINETTPADISEPYELEETADPIQMTESLIALVDAYRANGLIKSFFAYKTLRINLVLVLEGLKDLQEFENDLVTNPDDEKLQKKIKRLQEGVEKSLEAFVAQVNFYRKNRVIDSSAALDLVSKAEKILQEISD